MYRAHFQLERAPFSLAPDPDCIYLSAQHQEALAHLTFALERGNGGFAAITGEVGTGKTTLSRVLLADLPTHVRAAYIFNPRLTGTELLESVCDELAIKIKRRTVKTMTDAITAFLLKAYAAGERVILIVDEAQGLSAEALEQLRLLTNLETSQDKLLQITLLGQPELATLLQRHDLRQLRQRITLRYHLGPLSRSETYRYIRHRLHHAGGDNNLFTRAAMYRLHAFSGGIPRLINIAADRALLVAYSANRPRAGFREVRSAIHELRSVQESPRRGIMMATVISAGLLLAFWLASGTHALPDWQSQRSIPYPRIQAQTSTFKAPPAASPNLQLAPALEQWRALEGLWQAADGTGFSGNQCPPNLRHGLRCVALRTRGWPDVLRLQRPVMLVLIDGRITMVREWQGQMALGPRGDTIVSPELMRSLWDGALKALYSVPETVPDHFGKNSSGPAVAWLGALLDHATGYQRGFRMRDTVDQSMLAQSDALRARVGLHKTDSVTGIDLMLATAMAHIPPQPRLQLDLSAP